MVGVYANQQPPAPWVPARQKDILVKLSVRLQQRRVVRCPSLAVPGAGAIFIVVSVTCASAGCMGPASGRRAAFLLSNARAGSSVSWFGRAAGKLVRRSRRAPGSGWRRYRWISCATLPAPGAARLA